MQLCNDASWYLVYVFLLKDSIHKIALFLYVSIVCKPKDDDQPEIPANYKSKSFPQQPIPI